MTPRVALAVAAMMAPVAAHAQALDCRPPTRVPPIHAELPSADQPARVLPIGGYTLAITWSPEYCHGHARDSEAALECAGRAGRFGFTLHGLWPDGIGPAWPQYCRATALLPAAVVRAQLCATPSAQLLQHEWAKHGTCMATTPADYFARSTGLFARLRYPDMAALSRRQVTVGQLASAMARANPGIDAAMMRVTTNKRGWLGEVWLCLDRRFVYRRCAATSGGSPAAATVKIWRGGAR